MVNTQHSMVNQFEDSTFAALLLLHLGAVVLRLILSALALPFFELLEFLLDPSSE
jgi:hypothetical protein